MTYVEEDYNEYLLIKLTGEIDLSCSPQVRNQILKSIQNNKNVLVDLSMVEYIDSSGIASLVEGYQTARTQGSEFALLGVSKSAMQVLQLSRLDKIFIIYDSLDDVS